MNVVIADKFVEKGVEELRRIGCEITIDPTLSGSALTEAIVKTGCRVLVVRSTKVPAAALEASDKLALVVRAGAGYDTIDVETASRRSIMVANCPGKNAVAVAELTFALILALDRRLVENVNDLRRGVWNKKEYAQARGLQGRTLGILGLGQIGRCVAARGHAFGMNVVAWSRSLTNEQAESLHVLRCTSPADVASACDVLSVHLPAAPETREILNANVLNRLAPGSYVINTARPEVLDYSALASAMKERNLRVGLDVFPHEPAGGTGKFHADVLKASAIAYGTHHIGASTQQAQEAIAEEAVRIVRTFCESGRVMNCVNLRERGEAGCTLRVRHLNKPGVLAFVLNALSVEGINVEEMENVICEGGESACAQIKMENCLTDDRIAALQEGHAHILGVSQSHREQTPS